MDINGVDPKEKGSNNTECWLDTTVLSALNYITLHVNLLLTKFFPIGKE
jgi:hypothetical protein